MPPLSDPEQFEARLRQSLRLLDQAGAEVRLALLALEQHQATKAAAEQKPATEHVQE